MTWDALELLKRRLANGDAEGVIGPLQEMRSSWRVPALATVLADAWMRLGRSDEALAALYADINDGISNHWTYYCLGQKLASLGRLNEAAEAFRRCHALRGWGSSEEKGYFFTNDYICYHIGNWRQWFGSMIRASPIRILEIGSGQGGSTLWFLDHVVSRRGGSIVCVDTWEKTAGHTFLRKMGLSAESIFDDNIKASGRADCVIKTKGLSQSVLPELPSKSFDFIYIDGSCNADVVIQDAINAHRLLALGGYLLFNNINSVGPKDGFDAACVVDFFSSVFVREYRQWHRGAQLLLQKRTHSSLPSKIIWVLGMHRSGTSALSGLLCHSGFTGPKNLDPAGDDNPTGYWEPVAVRAFHDDLLAQAKSSWNDLLLHDDLSSHRCTDASLDQLEEALQHDYSHAASSKSVVLIKDPRQCRLQSVWNRWLDTCSVEASVLLVIRQPLAVALSLQHRNHLPVNRSLLLWLSHTLEAEQKSRHLNRIVVAYEKFLEDPISTLHRCQLHAGLAAKTPDSEQLAQLVRPDLNHFRDGKLKSICDSADIDGDLLALANRVYDWLEPFHGSAVPASESDVLDQAYADTRHRLKLLAQQSSTLQMVQLFWESVRDGGFREQDSVRTYVAVGREFTTIDLPLPLAVASCSRLRLDPAEEACVIDIESIDLLGPGNKCLWHWNPGLEWEEPGLIAANSRTLFLDSGQLVSASNDPSLYLAVDPSILQQITEGSRLVITARWQEIPEQLANNIVAGLARPGE